MSWEARERSDAVVREIALDKDDPFVPLLIRTGPVFQAALVPGMEGAVARSRPSATGAHPPPRRRLGGPRRRRAGGDHALQARPYRAAAARPGRV
jgi:hypothetical protein